MIILFIIISAILFAIGAKNPGFFENLRDIILVLLAAYFLYKVVPLLILTLLAFGFSNILFILVSLSVLVVSVRLLLKLRHWLLNKTTTS